MTTIADLEPPVVDDNVKYVTATEFRIGIENEVVSVPEGTEFSKYKKHYSDEEFAALVAGGSLVPLDTGAAEVAAQNDELQEKNEQLEAENETLEKQIADLRSQLEAAKTENKQQAGQQKS